MRMWPKSRTEDHYVKSTAWDKVQQAANTRKKTGIDMCLLTGPVCLWYEITKVQVETIA